MITLRRQETHPDVRASLYFCNFILFEYWDASLTKLKKFHSGILKGLPIFFRHSKWRLQSLYSTLRVLNISRDFRIAWSVFSLRNGMSLRYSPCHVVRGPSRFLFWIRSQNCIISSQFRKPSYPSNSFNSLRLSPLEHWHWLGYFHYNCCVWILKRRLILIRLRRVYPWKWFLIWTHRWYFDYTTK